MKTRSCLLTVGVAVATLGVNAVAGTGWPLVTMRQMGSTSFVADDMRAMIAINAKYPGSCDEYWLAEGYPLAQTTAVRRATALGAYAEPLKQAGIVPGFQQGVTLGHDFSRVPKGGVVFSDAAYQVDVDGKKTAFLCPTSPEVLEYEEWFAETYVRLGKVESFWLDDDLRFGWYKHRAASCWCPRCLKLLNEKAGTNYTREEFVKRLDAPDENDPLRAVWSEFKMESLVRFALAARRGAKRANPNVRLGCQVLSSNSITSGRDYRPLLEALSDGFSDTVGIRPGDGFWYDRDSASELPCKLLAVAREAERCRRYPNWRGCVVYEQENYPHFAMQKSAEAIVKECAAALAVGCDAVSQYWYSSDHPEPFDHYEDVARLTAAWRPYLKRLSDLAPKTHLGGVARRIDPDLMTSRANTISSQLANTLPRRHEADLRLALMGVPVTVEESGTKSFYDPASVPGGDYTTAQRAALLDALDALPGGPVCVRVDKVHPLLVYPRVDAQGRTAAVTFINVSVGGAARIPVRLRRPAGARLALVRPCADDVVLTAERGGGDELAFVLPDLPAWSMATVFCGSDAAADYPIRAAKMADAKVTGGFWLERLETNRVVTLKTDFAKCNETPRIANFTNAAVRAWGKHGGAVWDDSDVYKVMEGAAYVLATHPDAELEGYVDWLIGQIAKAQEPDGYLYTARMIGNDWINKTARWEELDSTHELYCMGHMIEAAVAWHEATGKTNFLAVAVKAADMMCRTFGYGPTELRYAPGHQEIELALCKLFRTTGDRRYLDLAKFFLDIRGRADIRHPSPKFGPTWGATLQDHLPVLRQTEAVGHAVRAAYMYAGMADVAALKGERAYVAAVERLWEDVVGRKLALTGGIGGRAHFEDPVLGKMGETFAPAYDLPNEAGVTYNETCAAIGNMLWNERMFQSSGDAKYVDVMERTLYNGFLSGVSLSGDEFFYPNPLASTNGYRRSKWFGCSCCPVNVVRFMPQVPALAYATDGRGTLFWNLFMEGEATVDGVKVVCKTAYPWDGKAVLTVGGQQAYDNKGLCSLKIRIPGWARGRPVPSDLYAQTQPSSETEVAVTVNGEPVDAVSGRDGYIAVEREWRTGDTVELNLPMPVKRIRAHEKVVSEKGRLAVERGPIVYCAEGCDNGGKAYDASLPADAVFIGELLQIGDQRFVTLRASNGLKLVPYCLWGNREPGNEMQCWFKE